MTDQTSAAATAVALGFTDEERAANRAAYEREQGYAWNSGEGGTRYVDDWTPAPKGAPWTPDEMFGLPLPEPVEAAVAAPVSESEAASHVSVRSAESGAAFVLDLPNHPPALWGEGGRILWARGEGCMVYAPQGVGKTLLAQQLVNARLGIGPAELLGFPVLPVSRVLYLAMDRPPQIARSWRRMVSEADRALLHERVRIWRGPLPFALKADDPARLTRWARVEHGATCIVVDSYKNLVPSLSNEESGALIDAAMQAALAAGIDWLALHHPRKATAENRQPKELDDVYGSTWLTAGMGSVLGLWGKAGDEVVSLAHLKQPAEVIGPLTLMHDHAAGYTSVIDVAPASGKAASREAVMLERFIRAGAGKPLTKADFADLGGERTIRDSLHALVERGRLDYAEGGGRGAPSTWALRPLTTSGRSYLDDVREGSK